MAAFGSARARARERERAPEGRVARAHLILKQRCQSKRAFVRLYFMQKSHHYEYIQHRKKERSANNLFQFSEHSVLDFLRLQNIENKHTCNFMFEVKNTTLMFCWATVRAVKRCCTRSIRPDFCCVRKGSNKNKEFADPRSKLHSEGTCKRNCLQLKFAQRANAGIHSVSVEFEVMVTK